MANRETQVNVQGLDALLKALKAKPPKARVGILGGNARSSSKGTSTQTNAQIGAAHEFGTSKLPQRSFLRVPITDHLQKRMQNSNLLDKDVLKAVIKEGSVVPWLTRVAMIAEDIVLGAFDSGGYGKWAPWANPNYKNNTGMLLVDSQQLRNSITYEVTE